MGGKVGEGSRGTAALGSGTVVIQIHSTQPLLSPALHNVSKNKIILLLHRPEVVLGSQAPLLGFLCEVLSCPGFPHILRVLMEVLLPV